VNVEFVEGFSAAEPGAILPRGDMSRGEVLPVALLERQEQRKRKTAFNLGKWQAEGGTWLIERNVRRRERLHQVGTDVRCEFNGGLWANKAGETERQIGKRVDGLFKKDPTPIGLGGQFLAGVRERWGPMDAFRGLIRSQKREKKEVERLRANRRWPLPIPR